MRAPLLLLLLGACATHDVLRSEPIAERAVCGGMEIGIFGRPHGIPACADFVTNLGDGCYAVKARGRRALVQCAANAPDGHVMCLVDQPDDVPVFRGDRIHKWMNVFVPDEPRGTGTQLGRCRGRYRTWVAEVEPRRSPPALIVTGWSSYSGTPLGKLPDSAFMPDEDSASLERIIPMGYGSAYVCPGRRVEITFPDDLPARFSYRLRAAIERAFAAAPMQACGVIGFRLSPLQRPEVTAQQP